MKRHKGPIHLSAQAIVFDESGRLILEENKKIGKYSFIGGAFESGRGDKELIGTLMREITEETTLIIESSRLLKPQTQPITRFGTGLWKSTYFLLQVTQEESQIILSREGFKAFDSYPENNFSISEKRFKAQVDRGRKYFNS